MCAHIIIIITAVEKRQVLHDGSQSFHYFICLCPSDSYTDREVNGLYPRHKSNTQCPVFHARTTKHLKHNIQQYDLRSVYGLV